MRRTIRWAERARAARARPTRPLFGIVQGGIDAGPAARVRRARRSRAGRSTAIAIGGRQRGRVAGRDGRDPGRRRRGARPADRPRYLMGVGRPAGLLGAVEHGDRPVRLRLPTRVARTGQVWTDAGRLNLRNAPFLDDPGPIDPACGCEACRGHSRAYLAHLFRARELLAYRLATVHNLTWTLKLLRRLRASLADGSLRSWPIRSAPRSPGPRLRMYDGV